MNLCFSTMSETFGFRKNYWTWWGNVLRILLPEKLWAKGIWIWWRIRNFKHGRWKGIYRKYMVLILADTKLLYTWSKNKSSSRIDFWLHFIDLVKQNSCWSPSNGIYCTQKDYQWVKWRKWKQTRKWCNNQWRKWNDKNNEKVSQMGRCWNLP